MTTWSWAAVQAYLVSQGYQAWSVVLAVATVGYSLGPANGGYNDWPSFVAFAGHAWFGVAIALVFGIGPYARAKQGGDAATTVVKGANATSIPNTLVNPSLIPAVGTTVPKGST